MAKASSLAEDLTKELECAVCLEQYKEPKVLPCLHSFCKKCREGLLTKQGLAWKINCPSCRISVEIPQGQVDALPINFFLNNLLSMVSLHSERSNVECDNCDSGDPAINRCTICCHFLCEFCTAGHKRGRSTKTHHLMSIEEAKEEGPQAVVRPSFCKEHEGEMLKLFCETCSEAICRDCTIVKHRDHKYTFVKDAFAKEKDIVMKTLSETKTKASIVKDSLDGISEMKKIIQSNAEQIVQDITSCFNDLTVSLKTRLVELVSGVEELKKSKLKSLEIQQQGLETALASVQSSVEFTEKAFKNGSEVEILSMHKQMSRRLQELNSAKWQLKPCADDAMAFKAENKLQLNQEIGTFGLITDVVTHAGTSTLTMGHGSEGVMYNTLCGQPIKFTIIAKERNGRKRTEGGDIFIAICTHSIKKFPCILEVRDCGDGTYTFLFTPQREGQMELSVLALDHHVQGSPFTWFVEKWNLMGILPGHNKGPLQLSEEKLTARYIFKTSTAYQPYGYGGFGQPNQFGQGFGFGYSQGISPFSPFAPSEDQPLYVVGSLSFNGGKHLWKVKLLDKVSVGVSIGIIDTNRISGGQQVKPGNWWVWNTNFEHLSSTSSKKQKSTITKCASKDIIELYLNCDDGTLMMYNQRTKQSDIWDGVRSEVKPVFQMTTDGHQVSLQVKD